MAVACRNNIDLFFQFVVLELVEMPHFPAIEITDYDNRD